MPRFLSFVFAVAVFLTIYGLLRQRGGRKSGTKPPVQWGWLAAILGCALIAFLAGLVI